MDNPTTIYNDYQFLLDELTQFIKASIDDEFLCLIVDNEKCLYENTVNIDEEKEKAYRDIIEHHDNLHNDLVDYFSKQEHVYVFPFLDNHDIHGDVIVFSHRDYSMQEKESLLKIIKTFESVFYHIYTQGHFCHSVFEQVMSSVHANVIVTDIDNDDIVYMNDHAKQTYHVDDLTQHKCYEVLRSKETKRCPDCPINYLKNHPHECYHWEEYNEEQNCIYENYDHLIEWFDKRIVHVEYSLDITEFTQIKNQAFHDDLTGIFNRRAGKRRIIQQIQKAKQNKKDVILCLYDVNCLKETNDAFGHREGDYKLKVITKVIKKYLKQDDVFMRLSGDEFIVSLYDYRIQDANQFMTGCLKELHQIEIQEQLPYSLDYCFGLYKITPDNQLRLDEMIMNADEKMYIWKKKAHLKNSLEALEKQSPIVETFDYDKDLLYAALSKSTDDYIFVCNMKTNVFKYTPEMVEEFEFPSQILTNAAMVFGSRIHEDDKYEFLNSNQQIADGRVDSHIVEYRALNKNKEYVWLRCRGHVEYDENGEPSLFAGFISNLGKKNYRDSLTGLYNTFEFEKRIQEATGEFSIMIINIHNFKLMNQLYDREFGNSILRIVGQNLQTLLHKETTVFKLDGDEFGLILKDTDEKTLNSLFQKIQSYSQISHSYEGKVFSCQFSCGVAMYPRHGKNYLELRKNCEIALHYSQRFTQQKMIIFNHALSIENTFTLQLLNALEYDILNDFQHFYLVFQPKVTSINHQLMGFEVLCRWNHPDFPHVGPGEFIPMLENSGDIIVLGNWIFQQSVQFLKSWLEYDPDIIISINVSPIQLIEDEFPDFIKETLHDYDVNPTHVIIELTETTVVKNGNLAIEAIEKIRSFGVQIAMDDFGKGYSSLAVLRDEPLDFIKIDQSFVRDIAHNSYNYAFMKFMIELCHQINLKVIIEGVETKEELNIVESFSPDYIQGFYTGKPMPYDESLQLIKKKNIDNDLTNR